MPAARTRTSGIGPNELRETTNGPALPPSSLRGPCGPLCHCRPLPPPPNPDYCLSCHGCVSPMLKLETLGNLAARLT